MDKLKFTDTKRYDGILCGRTDSRQDTKASAQGNHISPKMAPYLRALDKDPENPTPAEVFYQMVEKMGVPLVEDYSEEGSGLKSSLKLVTFLYRLESETHDVVLLDGACTWRRMPVPLHRLGCSNVFYMSFLLRSDARFLYKFILRSTRDGSEEAILDPVNKMKFVHLKDDECGEDGATFSVLELPDAPKSLVNKYLENGEIGVRHAKRKGRLVKELMETVAGGKTYRRRMFVYVANEVYAEKSGVTEFPFVLLLSGVDFLLCASMADVLDILIEDGHIPPVVVAFLDTVRIIDSNGDVVVAKSELQPGPEFSEYIHQRLLVYLSERYSISSRREDRVIGGFGMGAVLASYVVLEKPFIFKFVISQSGCFWWPYYDDDSSDRPPNEQSGLSETDAIARLVSEVKVRRDLVFCMDVGLLENGMDDRPLFPNQLHANRHFRDVLKAAGYRVQYNEYNGDHSFLNWRSNMAVSLSSVLGSMDLQKETAEPESMYNRLLNLLLGE